MGTDLEPTFTLIKREEYWVAIDVETGVGGQGPTREAALAELDDAVALYRDSGTANEAEAAVVEELGIDPDEVESTNELPEFLR